MNANMLAHRRAGAGPTLLFFVALTIAAVVGQTWWVILQDRQLTLESEKANGLVTVRIREEHATQTLQDAERKFNAVTAAIHAASEDGFSEAVAIREVHAQGLQDYRYLKAIQYINLKGQSWITSRDYPSHRADVGDRDYVRYLLSTPSDTRARLGRPFQSPYDSELVVPVGRNLYARNGRHVGLISIDIRLSYFADVYSRVAKDSNAMVSLLANDGFIVVRSPFEARYANRDIAHYAVLQQLRDAGVEGSFEDDSLLDDELPRLYTYRKIKGLPVTTVYGRDFDSILADWRVRTTNRIAFSAAMIGFICVLTFFLIVHIRRLRESEESLRNSEHKFVTIFQRSPVPLALVRLANDQYVEINGAWTEQFGYAREEVIGRTALEIGVWAAPAERQALIDQLVREGGVERTEVRYRHKDGRILVCQVSGRLFETVGEQMFIFSLVDITHLRTIEHEIRELNAELEERVRVRTLNLEQANTELADALASLQNMQRKLIRSEKMAALGSLVAGVAHELNTPIGNSVTVASTLMEQTETVLSDERAGRLRRSLFEQYLANASAGTELLLRTLRRASELVSSFKQVAVDQASDQRRCFDLQNALQEVAVTLAPSYKKTPYTLVLDLTSGIELDSYPGPLGQVITNFINNSLTHAFEGRPSGTMRLATRKLDDSHVEIIFSDDDIGIPEADQKRVFDPFFTTKLGQGGSGLGMNIVYNLVTGVLGGEIELQSRPGAGTPLTLVLPLRAPQTARTELQTA
ncbi:ATP-binding protein [Noviherbaspirillum sp.]|jgi:PAS domain S-box-containing protein|uniref:ATP-binding protein n=1 Tax=Noviherbaspirillum sp. TaxID=1926288 RepID=UPI0025CFDE70|nr:ATP-binding protein [Noviherbaspirillum sp.]